MITIMELEGEDCDLMAVIAEIPTTIAIVSTFSSSALASVAGGFNYLARRPANIEKHYARWTCFKNALPRAFIAHLISCNCTSISQRGEQFNPIRRPRSTRILYFHRGTYMGETFVECKHATQSCQMEKTNLIKTTMQCYLCYPSAFLQYDCSSIAQCSQEIFESRTLQTDCVSFLFLLLSNRV